MTKLYPAHPSEQQYCYECTSPLAGPLCLACNPPGIPIPRALAACAATFIGGGICGALLFFLFNHQF